MADADLPAASGKEPDDATPQGFVTSVPELLQRGGCKACTALLEPYRKGKDLCLECAYPEIARSYFIGHNYIDHDCIGHN